MQAETADCALAALAMIARFHGHQVDLSWLRQQAGRGTDGPNLACILAKADLLDFNARPVRASISELSRLQLPAILHWEFKHFVVLEKITSRSLVICDPAAGRHTVELETAARLFTGVAVEFTPASNFRAQVAGRRLSLSGLLGSCKGLWRYLALMLVLLIVGQLLGLAVPVATQLLIDELVLGQDKEWLGRMIGGIACILLAMLLIDTLRQQCALFAGVRLSVDTATAAVSHVLRLPARSLERRTTGDTLSRIDSMQPIQQVMTSSLLNALVQFVTLATTFLLMLLYSPALTAISLLALIGVVLLQAALLPGMRARNLDAVVAGAEARHSLIESLRAFAVVSSFGLTSIRLNHWRQAFVRASNARADQDRLGIVASAGQGILSAIDQLAFLFVGVAAVANKNITLGVLFAFVSLRGRLGMALVSLIETARDLYLARSHMDRVGELLAEEPEPRAPPAARRAEPAGRLACHNVCFRYPGGQLLLDDFNCEVSPGERVVICGPSGVGKTSLLRLLAVELKCTAGSVQYDGYDTDLWDLDCLRARSGMVRQSDALFMGSVADNICCFSSSPDVARIRDVAGIAAIWDDILALPMKLETVLADGGSGLSGGQIQRLLLARALYRKPKILFLDEATNQLDAVTQNRVLRNLAALDMTIVSVAHDQNTVLQSGRPLLLPAAAP
ncbi:MAG TPA: peptidase domain-containing ABC transporter [Woeseiaceae bacterium]|nr:peptidase domain-containing ABC transporter [Woeseiaceae bacterium]